MHYLFLVIILAPNVVKSVSLSRFGSRLLMTTNENLPTDPEFLQLFFLNKIEEHGHQFVSNVHEKIISHAAIDGGTFDKYVITFKARKEIKLADIFNQLHP